MTDRELLEATKTQLERVQDMPSLSLKVSRILDAAAILAIGLLGDEIKKEKAREKDRGTA